MTRRVCLDCNKITTASRCPTCAAALQRRRDAARGTTTQRGLGWAHQRQVRELKRETGPLSHCPRCGREITKANPITGAHGVARAHGGQDLTHLECLICNSSTGARIRRS